MLLVILIKPLKANDYGITSNVFRCTLHRTRTTNEISIIRGRTHIYIVYNQCHSTLS